MSESITTVDAIAATSQPSTAAATRLTYFDTTIWNRICNQGPNARTFTTRLGDLNCHLVVGLNVYFELLRTFVGSRPNSDARARQLFRCLSDFLNTGLQIVKTWDEILVDEARCSVGLTTRVPLLYNDDIHSSFRYWSELHSSGEVPTKLPEVVNKRMQASKDVHASAVKSVVSQPDLIKDLRNIQDIAGFLATETTGTIGTEILSKYLLRVFAAEGQPLPMKNERLARTLLSFKSNKVALALSRNDIYGTWRAARSETVTLPKCVPDDGYHVVNAAYCDVFVTADQDGQAVTAEHVLPGIKALVYLDGHEPVLDWLEQQLG